MRVLNWALDRGNGLLRKRLEAPGMLARALLGDEGAAAAAGAARTVLEGAAEGRREAVEAVAGDRCLLKLCVAGGVQGFAVGAARRVLEAFQQPGRGLL